MEYLQMVIITFVILCSLIIGLFNSYRNVVKKYKLQVELNRKVMTVIKKE